MKKRSFPKGLRFGAYLPQRCGKSYLKLGDSVAALEQFITEYFDGYATVSINVSAGTTDAIYIDSENTAYLFRNVMSAMSPGGIIDINITNNPRDFIIAFSSRGGRIDIRDIELHMLLINAAALSGFELSIIGNTISLSAKLEKGKIVISALAKEDFAQTLKKVFFD